MKKNKIFKTLIITALTTIVLFGMVGCGKDKVSDYNKKRFVMLDDEYKLDSMTIQLYYDSVTGVVYKRIVGSGDGSPLIGQNRLPMTLDEYFDTRK